MENPTKPSPRLPEDDGMGTLRKRLLALQAEDLPAVDMARCMHQMMLESYHRSQQTTPAPRPTSPPITIPSSDSLNSSPTTAKAWKQAIPVSALESLKFWQHPQGDAPSSEQFVLTAEDVKPTFATVKGGPKDTSPEAEQERPLGCSHYRRNVKLQCSTCGKWYTCRFCHDAAEDHSLIRKDTKNMLCMLCAYPQKAGDACINCGVGTARYYCNVCKLWDDHPDKNIYHCNDCGICRRGMGLGKDFFHCKKCCACISISIQASHKCIERSTDCDCPICGEYMFTSPNPVVFMVCGHSIHSKCYNEHMKRSYKCPICNKSLLNMESYFRRLDLDIQSQPMPAEFRSTSATILCNDCSGKSTVPYHWLGLKCAICRSYNTAEIRINGDNGSGSGSSVGPSTSPDQASRASQDAQGATGSEQSQVVSEDTASGAIATGQSARRRHSSHTGPGMGIPGARLVLPDRLARSASPPPAPGLGMRSSVTAFSVVVEDYEDDTDEDMLGLWGHRFHDSSSDGAESLSDEAENEGDEDNEEDDYDEDEDDDDNEIVLIGHR